MLEKEDGLIGPTLKKKKPQKKMYFRGRLDIRTILKDCWSLASLSSSKFALSGQPSGHQFSLSSRHIKSLMKFPEARE